MSEGFDTWRREGLIFNDQGHDIFYRVSGTGPALLALHGFPSASWDWRLIWPDLTRQFQVIAADMIGFGWSAKPRNYQYSIMNQARLQESLLQELGVNRVHLLAHDYGDTVAQELLARYNERVRKGEKGLMIDSVCFLNGGIFPETHRPRLIQRLLASPLGAFVGLLTSKRSFAAGMTAIFGPATPPGHELIHELWTLFRHHHGHRVMHKFNYMAERRHYRERWVGALTQTKVPLRVINGASDPISGSHMVTRYRQVVPAADTVELPGIGHYPHIEDPAGVLKAFFEFHKQIPVRIKSADRRWNQEC